VDRVTPGFATESPAVWLAEALERAGWC